MIVVSNTTPINYLVLTGKQDILQLLFGQVIVPEAVMRELQAAAAPPQVGLWLRNRPDWIETRQVATPSDTSLSNLDEGEREAIQLAEELKADLLMIDERAGRDEALKRGLPVIGTLAVLESAAERGLLDFALALDELKAHKFFISPALERDFLERDARRKASRNKPPE
jgi:predicted nucleic acid-binding protein